MLTVLRIRNLGLIDDLVLEIQPGFTALTGETGVGKSLVIGALSLLSGQRADRTLIRSGADSCTIEALFAIGSLLGSVDALLRGNGLDPCRDGELSISRSLSRNGPNRQYINHSPASLALLSQLGGLLIDIHGSNESQSLFDNRKQLRILDALAGCDGDRDTFASLTREWDELQRRRAELSSGDAALAREIDLLRHQTGEIERAELEDLDEAELEKEHSRHRHAVSLREGTERILHAIAESDPSVQELLGRIGQELESMGAMDPELGALIEEQCRIVEEVGELQNGLSRYLDRIEVNPERLEELEERIDHLQTLKRKYGSSLEDIRAFGNRARDRLALLESRDEQLERIEARLAPLQEKMRTRAARLSSIRRKKGKVLARKARRELEDLGFVQGQFEVAVSPLEVRKGERPPATGADRIEFLFGPNPGEPLMPLRKVASSGEIARVMLALRTVLSDQDGIPLLVFDEADANIGGETAHAFGEKMQALGRGRQVICITHLAPVAASAHQHLKVSKTTRKGRTLTDVDPLADEERVDELARMLGGRIDAARRHAAALLESKGSGRTP